jgi:hypothetical protein
VVALATARLRSKVVLVTAIGVLRPCGAMMLVAALACGCPKNGSDATGPEETPDTVTSERVGIPEEATPVERLSNDALHHVELVRIARNFGKEHFEIALDAWTPADGTHEISDVRLWWLMTNLASERRPFSAKTRDQFDIDYARIAADRWRVGLESDRKRFEFLIEYAETGTPAAFADVETDAGVIEHCRVESGTLQARKLLGAPIGIKGFEVSCVDDSGRTHRGDMVEHKPR